MSANKDRIWIVDTNLVGPKRRRNNPDGFHPMARASWVNLEDRLRAVLAKYYTVYRSTKGETLWNMANPGNASEGGANGVGLLADQVKNIVLRVGYDESLLSPLLELKVDMARNAAWNAYTNRDPSSQSYLYPDVANFNFFVASLLATLVNQGKRFEDHTSNHYMLSADSEIREASDVECSVQSVYRYFVTSAPAYEEVISAPAFPEHILPSAYILQGEAFNTSSSPLTNYSIQAVSLNGHIPWFENSTETNEGVYYELYSSASQGIISTEQSADVGDSLQRLRNMVVLHSDLGLATETGITLATVPFYTKITIGRDDDNVTGKYSDISIYEQIATDDTTKDFIDYAQIKAVFEYLSTTPETKSFRTTLQKLNSPNDASNFDYSTSIKEYRHLYGSVDELRPTTLSTGPLDTMNQMSQGPDFVLLRDFTRPQEGFPTPSFSLSPTHINNAIAATDTATRSTIKSYSEILAGTKAHTEVLMYIVEKRRVIDGSPGPLLQSFFISAKFDTNDNQPIVFYDTQVKYGQRYVYKIKKIVTVFGNQYRYHTLELMSEESPAEDDFDLPDVAPPDISPPVLQEELVAQEVFNQPAEELEEMQDLMDELVAVAGQRVDDILNETLQEQFGRPPGLLQRQGMGTQGAPPQSPGDFGGPPMEYGSFEMFDEIEEPEF